ncbi:MurR/RpiR family transcriptional regulator [Luteococcus peritonei]|uniref:MurR/RpiR family transcriptional regulator n=1 Tax=Luteococcus peritonei TaxID=88874 RepID=A0ABW4RXV1_9ACTN
MSDTAGLHQRIRRHFAELPPQEQKAAGVVLERIDDLAACSAAEIADASGVSRATVSRLFRSLGYSSFVEVKEEARALRSRGVPLVLPDEPLRDRMEQEAANISRALSSPAALADAAGILARAPRVVVIGLRNSYPVALHCRTQLAQLRPGVVLAPQPGQTLGEELVDLGDDDVVLLFGFRRRAAGFEALLETLTESSARVVLVADESARLNGTQADIWLECPTEGVGAVQSYAAAMALVSALADELATVLGEPAAARARQIQDLYEELDELSD